MEQIDHFISEYNHHVGADVNATLFLHALIELGQNDLELNVRQLSNFKRNYRRDVLNISRDIVDGEIVNIDISRDGFYDILPESLTHNYRDFNGYINEVDDFKQKRKEEKQARFFYGPLENELFRFRGLVEKYESDFFSGLNLSEIIPIVREILLVDSNVPNKYVIKLFYTLIEFKTFKDQRIERVIERLESILEEKVSIHIGNIQLENLSDQENKTDDLILGVNFTLESKKNIFLPKYNFVIGPLKNSENLELFFENESLQTFVKNFLNLFIPFHIQYEFGIELNFEDQKFKLEESNFSGRLGISTVI